jgi:large subunit ribosomal protein L32e
MTMEDHEMGKEKQLTKKISGNKKPKFRRQESWRYKRVTDRWRRPHGIDSKMRKKIKGWPASPTTGYRSPKKIRGIHPSGFVETRVVTLDNLIGIDPELQAIRIAHTVGGRKRVEILTRAEEKGIHVLNPRTPRESEALTESAELKEKESLSDGEK